MHKDVPTVLRILWVCFIILMSGMEPMVIVSPDLPVNTNTVCHEPPRLISAKEESMQDKARESLVSFWSFPRWEGAWMRSENVKYQQGSSSLKVKILTSLLQDAWAQL